MVKLYDKKFIKCTPVTFGFGHKITNSPYNQFKNKIKKGLREINFSLEQNVRVSFSIYIAKERLKYGNDLDNFAKPVIDALHDGKVIKDERQVLSIYMKKIAVDAKKDQGILVEIKEI